MVPKFVAIFMKHKDTMRAHFAKKFPQDYYTIVQEVIECINGYREPKCYESLPLVPNFCDQEEDTLHPVPDPERIHEIDDGTYQGKLIYIIGEYGPDPDVYWYTHLSYGSCELCDLLQGIAANEENPDEQLDDLMALALHIVQSLKPLER